MKSIADALLKLGHNEFVVRGDVYEGIEWVVEPEVIPSKEEVLAKVAELESLEQNELENKIAAKESALSKLTALGLTEEEVKALLGGI